MEIGCSSSGGLDGDKLFTSDRSAVASGVAASDKPGIELA